jgi:quercetin 2,3-dioxygenase
VSSIQLLRAADRFVTGAAGIETFHSFSFGVHYDPANTGFGVLTAHNDERLGPGAGFAEHPHRDCEILTWVVEGTLEHRDSSGRREQLMEGTILWQSAGRGIVHAEVNASDAVPLRFIQVWLTPDGTGLDPGYASAQVKLPPDRLITIASGDDPDAILPMLRQRHASCHAARMTAGTALDLPVAAYVHLFMIGGSIAFDGGDALGPGDAARLIDPAALHVSCLADAELLLWTMTATSRDLLAPDLE